MKPRLLDAARVNFESWSRLHGAAFEPAWSPETFAELLRNAGTFSFVVGPEDDPEGFIVVRIAADEAEVITLVVAEEMRRRGVGRVLTEAGADRAAQLGARTMFLEVGASNAGARSLYAKLGFVAVGERRAYYARAGAGPDNAVILKAVLPLTSDGKSVRT